MFMFAGPAGCGRWCRRCSGTAAGRRTRRKRTEQPGETPGWRWRPACLVQKAVELDHQVVQSALVSSVHADDLRSMTLVHGLTALRTPLAAVDGLVAIATPLSPRPHRWRRRTGPGPALGAVFGCPGTTLNGPGCRGNRESDARTRFQLLLTTTPLKRLCILNDILKSSAICGRCEQYAQNLALALTMPVCRLDCKAVRTKSPQSTSLPLR